MVKAVTEWISKSLTTFIYVAELNSFTKAAEKLGFSQSTISFQIRQLERELNSQLFERVNHTIALTEKRPGSPGLRSQSQQTDFGTSGKHAGNRNHPRSCKIGNGRFSVQFHFQQKLCFF